MLLGLEVSGELEFSPEELPESDGGLALGVLGSRAVEGPEGVPDCVLFPPAGAGADLDGERMSAVPEVHPGCVNLRSQRSLRAVTR